MTRAERVAQAQDKVRKWELQGRWKRYPQLGPVPAKWMDVGEPPTSLSVYVSVVLDAVDYAGAIAKMMNEPTPLLRFLEEREAV